MKRSLIASLLLGCSLILFAQPTTDELRPLQVDVVYLSSDLLEGRLSGSRGEQLAAEYIAARLQALEIAPKGTEGYFQPFSFTFSNNPHAGAGAGEKMGARNVIGYLDNQASQAVVIGAHFDHLGHGFTGSRAPGDSSVHNGADDNASGVAAMLYLAEKLAQGKASRYNYLFIAFSGEELGLRGSKYFVEHPTIELDQVAFMLNMDMVGRLNAEKVLAISGAGTSPAWKPALKAIAVGGIEAKISESGVGPSDHTSFYLKDLPVLHFFTGQHEDYHKPADDAHLVNYEGLYYVSEYLMALLEQLDGSGKLAFTKTKDQQQGRQTRFKVTLGVMPDYVHDGEGMRVDAVLADRSAAKAGMEDGDIILKIGEKEIADIYGYMEALGQYQSGDQTTVVVKRGEETVALEVTF